MVGRLRTAAETLVEFEDAADNRAMHRASFAPVLGLLLLAGLFRLSAPPAAVGAEPGVQASGIHSADPPLPIVAIQPMGGVESTLVAAVAQHIEQTFAVDLILLPAKPLPEAALYRPRMRFRGERVIGWLDAEKPAHVTAILGLMSSDLSVTKGEIYDWGVMGVASPALAAGVVSTHRLGGRRVAAGLATQRACQVAVHEMGHSFGLDHCRSPRCIMNDARGSIGPVDRSSGKFCEPCRGQLSGLLREE